jgi:Arc/MetJ-type ribon-helix-helix transcriptional regulator
MNIPPATEFLDFLREKVQSGEYPSEEAVWQEAMRRFRHSEEARSAADEEALPTDPIDYGAIAYCEGQIEGQEVPSIEEVRQILSKIPGSLSDAVSAEREDRF